MKKGFLDLGKDDDEKSKPKDKDDEKDDDGPKDDDPAVAGALALATDIVGKDKASKLVKLIKKCMG